ncbi:MAG: hypothetical protein QOF01_5476 [Thermomicrobiales bacterium]|jgi:hypothetical protein|nr:hypothetical protein [Thermomicrobiales bacterium]
MARKFGNRLAEIAGTIVGREPTGGATPPRTGTDSSSKRHLLALLIGTLAIMTFGLLVAFLGDDPSQTTTTPTVVTAPSPAGARPSTGPLLVLAA